MADYNSSYTGAQIDAGIATANTSLQTDDTGWAEYVDTQYTSGAPFSVIADTDTVIPNNGANANETQMPADVTTFYNGSTITGRSGDGIMITFECKLIPTSVGTTVAETWFDIGGSVGEIYRRLISFPKGTGVIRPINFTVAGYQLATWATNGATTYIRANGTMDVYDIRFVITRTHKAV